MSEEGVNGVSKEPRRVFVHSGDGDIDWEGEGDGDDEEKVVGRRSYGGFKRRTGSEVCTVLSLP